MAQTKCKECGYEVSKRTEKCHNCGNPLKYTHSRESGGVSGCFILLLIILCSFGYCVLVSDPTSPIHNTSPTQPTENTSPTQPTENTSPTQPTENTQASVDWKKIANDLVGTYPGDVIAIEQLNSSTCWAVLSSSQSNARAVEIAENIGFYVRNVTGVLKGHKLSVHVFRDGQHIAVARPSGNGFVGKLEFENWDPSSFNGEYRP